MLKSGEAKIWIQDVYTFNYCVFFLNFNLKVN